MRATAKILTPEVTVFAELHLHLRHLVAAKLVALILSNHESLSNMESSICKHLFNI